jgi:MoaA/NifB/PqqE/SkfB family radical SAM enzyme
MKLTGLHIEPTNICTLKCPRCARTKFLDQFKAKSWENQNLNLSSLKKFLDVDLTGLTILLCGNYGDPIYYPDIFPMIKWLKSKNSNISLITNGSYKKEEWWRELVSILTETDTIFFSVDGTPDNFTKYRINGDWESIHTGMKVVADSIVNSVWKYIPFSFNENDISYTKDLSQQIGIKNFIISPSDRWDSVTDPFMPSQSIEGPRHKNIIQWKYKNKKNQDITPKCFQGNQHFITADGYYTPCCFSNDFRFYYKTKFYKNHDQYDINNNSLSEILYREQTFFDQLTTTKPEFCTFNCATVKNNE